jgi:8-amino-7-oxononanoate synthase
MSPLEQYLAGKLREREDAGNLRRLTTGRAQVDFYSNDYLGLATGNVLAALMKPLPAGAHATGATGSRLLSGNSELAGQLEQTIASFHKAEAALLFNSGYDANMGLISAITGRNATILSDELCHASIIDGIRLSLATKYKFRHNDAADLERKLKKCRESPGTHAGPVIVVVESVYSMDGDMAPLTDIVQLCEQYDAQLIVDEAHATGVFGTHGEGLVCMHGLQDKVFARVHTFGKALGCHGAAVVGGSLLKQYLVNFARSFIYTTALPAHSLQAIRCAYEYLSEHTFSNQPLHHLISYFRECTTQAGHGKWMDSISPIQALVAGSNDDAKQIAAKIQQAGFQVNPILHPTVPPGMERLRVCLHTFNTKEQTDGLLALGHD